MRILAAVLLLSPFALSAQINVSAATNASITQANDANSSLSDVSAPVRVSTGVVAPKVIRTTDVEFQGMVSNYALTHNVVVDLMVDENGKPSDVKVERASDERLDQAVLDAVNKYRFTPGTVDREPVAMPLRLVVVLSGSLR